MNAARAPGLPVELRLEGRRVVLLGDRASERRAALEACGALVDADATALAGAWMVLHTAPVTEAEGAALRARCRAVGAWVWIEDRPTLSDVTFPALLESGPVRIAVSTGGRSSALARAVRDALRPVLGEAFATWAQDAVARGLRRPRGRVTGGFEALPPGD